MVHKGKKVVFKGGAASPAKEDKRLAAQQQGERQAEDKEAAKLESPDQKAARFKEEEQDRLLRLDIRDQLEGEKALDNQELKKAQAGELQSVDEPLLSGAVSSAQPLVEAVFGGGVKTGAVAGGALVAKQAAKTAPKVANTIGDFFKKNTKAETLSKTRVQNAFKINDNQFRALRKKFEGKQVDEILREISNKPLKSGLGRLSFGQKFTLGVVGFGALQFAGIGVWYAADNIGFMASSNSRKIANSVESGDRTVSEALEEIAFWESAVKSSKAAIVGFSAISANPIIWAGAVYFYKGANLNLRSIEEDKLRITGGI